MLILLNLLRKLIDIYIFIIIASALLSWTGYYVRPNIFTETIKKITEPAYKLVRKYVTFHIMGNIDISPIIIIGVLNIIYYFIQMLMFNSINSNINIGLE